MARIVRPMYKDPADVLRPLVGVRSKCLGVRVGGPHADIDLDVAGVVEMNGKGMSVSQDWRDLMPFLIPEELDDGMNGASGKGMAVFDLGQGTGAFAPAAVAAGLHLILKDSTTTAGNVCPVAAVPVQQFQDDLATTRPEWVIDPS